MEQVNNEDKYKKTYEELSLLPYFQKLDISYEKFLQHKGLLTTLLENAKIVMEKKEQIVANFEKDYNNRIQRKREFYSASVFGKMSIKHQSKKTIAEYERYINESFSDLNTAFKSLFEDRITFYKTQAAFGKKDNQDDFMSYALKEPEYKESNTLLAKRKSEILYDQYLGNKSGIDRSSFTNMNDTEEGEILYNLACVDRYVRDNYSDVLIPEIKADGRAYKLLIASQKNWKVKTKAELAQQLCSLISLNEMAYRYTQNPTFKITSDPIDFVINKIKFQEDTKNICKICIENRNKKDFFTLYRKYAKKFVGQKVLIKDLLREFQNMYDTYYELKNYLNGISLEDLMNKTPEEINQTLENAKHEKEFLSKLTKEDPHAIEYHDIYVKYPKLFEGRPFSETVSEIKERCNALKNILKRAELEMDVTVLYPLSQEELITRLEKEINIKNQKAKIEARKEKISNIIFINTVLKDKIKASGMPIIDNEIDIGVLDEDNFYKLYNALFALFVKEYHPNPEVVNNLNAMTPEEEKQIYTEALENYNLLFYYKIYNENSEARRGKEPCESFETFRELVERDRTIVEKCFEVSVNIASRKALENVPRYAEEAAKSVQELQDLQDQIQRENEEQLKIIESYINPEEESGSSRK